MLFQAETSNRGLAASGLKLLLLALLWLLAGPAWAQCPTTPLPAGCAASQVFQAFDVATGQEVQALCVGRPVRFAPGCGRVVPANLLFYTVQATTGLNVTNLDCNFTSQNNTYTPTAAGFMTVAELANPLTSGAQGTLYARNFQVYASPAPTFELVGCLGGQVRLTITDSSYDQYFVQVGGSAPVGPLPAGATRIIAAPAGSSVTVRGVHLGNALCDGQATQTVPALPAPVQPTLDELRTTALLPATLLLNAGTNLPAGYRYDVQRATASAPGNWQRVAAVAPGTLTITLPNAPAGLYRLGRRDVCQTDSAFSGGVPTLELRATSANNVNTLTWQAGGPVTSYTVLLSSGAVLATLPATATSYTDATAACGTSYTYTLQASTASGALAKSNAATVQTVSALAPPAPLTLASFDLQNRVVLSATLPSGAALPAGSTLTVGRQGGGAAATFTAATSLRDSTALAALLADPPCYAATLRDVCGNQSAASPATCPVLLTVAAADPQGRTAQLSWTALRGPGSPGAGASYRVLTLAPDGTVLATSATTAGLSYLDAASPADRQILRYRVAATGAGLPAGQVSYSNVATLVRQPLLVVPNAFTPNGDGLNDVLELKGRYLAAFTFVVVDRNGQEVFRSTDRSQSWDGTIRGHAPVNAAYVWRFTMTDEAGQPFSQTGSVSILK